MRKIKISITLITIVALLTMVTCAIAGQPTKEQIDVYEQDKLVKSVVFHVGSDRYFINNQTPGIKMDAKPFIEQGRTFVPIRYLSNALGVTDKYIAWNNPKVTLSEPGLPVVELAVGQKQIKSNGSVKKIDVAPLLRNGRTYLPARFVAEALGYQVDWDATNRIVLCYPKGQEKPDISKVIEYLGGQQKPTGTIDEIVAKATPFQGKPFNFEGWNFAPGWAESMQYEPMTNRKLDLKYQKVTVDELRQMNGIRVGDKYVVYDVKVTEKGVETTQFISSNFAPPLMLVEKGNVVRYIVPGNVPAGTYFIEKESFSGGTYENPLPPPDMSKVTGVMFEYTDRLLYVEVKEG